MTHGSPLLKTLQWPVALSKDTSLARSTRLFGVVTTLPSLTPTILQPHGPSFRFSLGALGQVLPLPSPILLQLRALPSMPPLAPLGVRSTTLCLRVYEYPGLLPKGSSNDTQHNFGVQESVNFLIHHG